MTTKHGTDTSESYVCTFLAIFIVCTCLYLVVSVFILEPYQAHEQSARINLETAK